MSKTNKKLVEITPPKVIVTDDDYASKVDRLTDSEIKERVESLYDEELYDELVDNVTQQYPKQLNTFGG